MNWRVIDTMANIIGYVANCSDESRACQIAKNATEEYFAIIETNEISVPPMFLHCYFDLKSISPYKIK